MHVVHLAGAVSLALAVALPAAAADGRSAFEARTAWRQAVADPVRRPDALRAGLASEDPFLRRAALWELSGDDPAAAKAELDRLIADPSPVVGTLLPAVARRILDGEERNDYLRRLMTATGDATVRKAANDAMEFPFFRVNRAWSVDPSNDHESSVVWSRTLSGCDWLFRTDPSGVGHLSVGGDLYRPSADTTGWRPIPVPRYFEQAGVGEYDGIVWYRLVFTLPEKPSADAYEIAFDAVDEEAWVWLNGKYVGQHAEGLEGWNKSFRFDCAAELNWGGENVLAVRVNDTFAGGGIWKPVRLEALKCH